MEGEANTKYLHAKPNGRRTKNIIKKHYNEATYAHPRRFSVLNRLIPLVNDQDHQSVMCASFASFMALTGQPNLTRLLLFKPT